MIYLDNAATTRPNEDALRRANEFLTEHYFNPSARYRGGESVARALKDARNAIASPVCGSDFGLLFTSGGTEADNHAVFSCARRGNAVTTSGEHSAVYESFLQLKTRGVEPRFAPLNRDGSVNADALLHLIDEKTNFVSVVHVNNETGAVNDILSIAKQIKNINPRIVFHSDGVQAYGKIPVRLSSEIDLYSISAHKIGALKGTGALIRNKKCNLSPLIFGGGQEGNLRSGTENTFGIMCFRYAAEAAFQTLEADGARMKEYRDLLWNLMDQTLFERISPIGGSPFILTVSAVGLKGEVLQRMLWDRGTAVGTGSACSSKKPFSRILEACGYDRKMLDGVLRFSFCTQTTEEEVRRAADVINLTAKEMKERLF